MINSTTVFILGAGASKPYYFPLGKKLLLDICAQLGDDGKFKGDIHGALGCDIREIEKFMEHLIKSGQHSVDAFLEYRNEFLEIGKVSIARALIPYEEENLVQNAIKKDDDWYGYLFNQMNTTFEDFDKNKVSFITFNYDRSLEYYLLQTIIHSYGVSEPEAIDKLKSIPIIHLHGQLGVLPGFQKDENEYNRAYSSRISTSDIQNCAKNIKIIHEAEKITAEFERAHEIIQSAEIRCFLGFGFHENNIERLLTPIIKQGHQKWIKFLGSAYGKEAGERKKIEKMFKLPIPRAERITFGDVRHGVLDFLRHNEVFV